jgi:Flp pilus assembly protein TadB
LERTGEVSEKTKPREEDADSQDTEKQSRSIENDIEDVTTKPKVRIKRDQTEKRTWDEEIKKEKRKDDDDTDERPKNWLERFAYSHFSKHLPAFPGFRETYEASFIPVIMESYLSTALFFSMLVSIPVVSVSFLAEIFLAKITLFPALLGSGILGVVTFGVSLFCWLLLPLEKRRSFKEKLEGQLAYSFGILGVLAASGMSIDRLFERMANAESNPVLSDLARRFLRNVRIFGLDTEAALREVAKHSPSETFSKMLESIAVAFKTTGSLHELITFESSRLLSQKKEKLKKSISSLAITAELYVTLVVVGPIIFIVMLTIFLFLPSSSSGAALSLPDPTLLINVLVFMGIPVISVIFLLILDSMVNKV